MISNHSLNSLAFSTVTHHPSIKVKYIIIDPCEVHFLDTTVFFNHINQSQKTIFTKVYFKPTHALLHKHSYHPKHTFRGIVKSQIIRFHRISSCKQDLGKAIQTLFQALRQRGYSKQYLRTIKNSTLGALSPIQPTHSHNTSLSITLLDPNLHYRGSRDISKSSASPDFNPKP